MKGFRIQVSITLNQAEYIALDKLLSTGLYGHSFAEIIMRFADEKLQQLSQKPKRKAVKKKQ